jgi:hypothetical protein
LSFACGRVEDLGRELEGGVGQGEREDGLLGVPIHALSLQRQYTQGLKESEVERKAQLNALAERLV